MVISYTAALQFQDGCTCIHPLSEFGIPVQLAKAKRLSPASLHKLERESYVYHHPIIHLWPRKSSAAQNGCQLTLEWYSVQN